MTWGLRRQVFYLGILVVFFTGLGFLLGYPYFNKEPTCFDGRKNGQESGVDCGGLCARACLHEVEPVSILWSQAFRVAPGRYNAVAYLENKNQNVVIERISYRFRFADRDNLYIGKRDGETYIPPGGRFAVFEPAINVGNSIPVYVTFEFTSKPVWTRLPSETLSELKVFAFNVKLEDQAAAPRLSATIKNNSLFILPEVNVVAILYDELGNAVASSRTYLEVLGREEVKEINFTWPEPITKKVVAIEVIPIYNALLAQIKN